MHAIFYSKIPTVRSENPKIFRLRRAKMYVIFYSKTPTVRPENLKIFLPAALTIRGGGTRRRRIFGGFWGRIQGDFVAKILKILIPETPNIRTPPFFI